MSHVVSFLSLVLVLALLPRVVRADTLPAGKGVIIASVNAWCIEEKYAYKSSDACAKEYAKRIADNDVGWVAIEVYKTGKGTINSDATIATLVKEIRAARSKTQIWLWAWIEPHDKDLEGAATVLVDAASAVSAAGVMLDVEGKWSKKGKADEASTLMSALMREADANDLSVGIMSYPGFKGGAQIPWTEFAKADFGMPMIGSSKTARSGESLCAWSDKGFTALVPVIYFPSSTKSTAKAWASYRFSNGAAALWSWQGIESGSAKQTAARWALLKDYSLADKSFELAECP